MKQKLTGSALGLLALLICAVPAYPWGWAAHTYVVDHAGTKRPAANLQEIYGSLAPDTFNYLSVADPSLQPIQDLLHGETHERPFPIWENASPELKPLAYGFVSHNEAWGEDWTAHIQNLTIGGREGYVIIKARELAGILSAALQGAASADALQAVAHEVVEYGVDLLVVKQLDPSIGEKLFLAADQRDDAFPALMTATFGPSLTDVGFTDAQAAALIVGAEDQFRTSMMDFGEVLAVPDEAQRLELLVQFLLPLAQAYFANSGIALPPGFDLGQFIAFALTQSMELCADDYLMELKRTTSHTVSELAVNGVLYQGMFTANR